MSEFPGRVLAIDPGARRVGLALSDPTRTVASPHGSIPNDGRRALVDRLVAVVEEHQVTHVICGLPLHLDMGESEGSKAARKLADHLRGRLDISVELVDEGLTSVEADELLDEIRPRRRKTRGAREQRLSGERDAIAAAVMLRDWLDT